MKTQHIGFDLLVHEAEDRLSTEDFKLLREARNARNGAYAPYSQFKVGAALMLQNGTIVIGSNQENASYPSGLCAERVAVFQAGARFPGAVIKTIAIVVRDAAQKLQIPAAPCGNCRQAIYEYESKQKQPIRILLQAGEGVIYECPSIAALLPLGFDGSFLS